MNAATMTEKLIEQFQLIKRLNEASGPIKANGKRISKREAISFECDAAIKALQNHPTTS